MAKKDKADEVVEQILTEPSKPVLTTASNGPVGQRGHPGPVGVARADPEKTVNEQRADAGLEPLPDGPIAAEPEPVEVAANPPLPPPSGEQDYWFMVDENWTGRVGAVNKTAEKIDGREFPAETAMIVACRAVGKRWQIQVHERLDAGTIENGETAAVGWNREKGKDGVWRRTGRQHASWSSAS